MPAQSSTAEQILYLLVLFTPYGGVDVELVRRRCVSFKIKEVHTTEQRNPLTFADNGSKRPPNVTHSVPKNQARLPIGHRVEVRLAQIPLNKQTLG